MPTVPVVAAGRSVYQVVMKTAVSVATTELASLHQLVEIGLNFVENYLVASAVVVAAQQLAVVGVTIDSD